MTTHVYRFINPESAGGGSGSAETYSQTFNSTSDWGVASSGEYTISITQATHEKSPAPHVQVFELNGSVYELVETGVEVNGSGTVTISVSESPNTRFAGRVVII